MRVEIDRDLCIGSGQCAMAVPEVFDQDDDGIAVLVSGTPGETHHDDVRNAAMVCPTSAIVIREG